MKRVKFCFGIHNPPAGRQFWLGHRRGISEIIFSVSRSCLRKIQIRISLHFTGILCDWMKEFHPEGMALVKTLVKRGQVELPGHRWSFRADPAGDSRSLQGRADRHAITSSSQSLALRRQVCGWRRRLNQRSPNTSIRPESNTDPR